MASAPLEMFVPGDLVRVRYRGVTWPGFYVFEGVHADGTYAIRRQGRASARYLEREHLELVDHDARWPR